MLYYILKIFNSKQLQKTVIVFSKKEFNMGKYDSSSDTMSHIIRVTSILMIFVEKLIARSNTHDRSKLQSPEKEDFDIYTPKLKETTYNSEEYKQNLQELKKTLEHHYARNRHHPEHHKNGINDMTLVDLIELLADWKASSERHHNGNILISIDENQRRFGIDHQLTKILINTVKELDLL